MPPTVIASERSFARRMDLTSLQLFVAVCELGSIGRAAEREFIAASAVSKRLSDLETTLSTRLLYRHARGVDLTPAGESLLHHARSVLYSLEKMQGELSEYADGVRGHVRMHANISAIVQFLPEDLGAFRHRHEEIKIDLEEHLSAEVMRAVQEGAADLGVCHAADGSSDLQSLPYRTDHLMLIVPVGHPLLRLAESATTTIDAHDDRAGGLAFAAALDFDHVGLHTNSSIYVATRQAALEAGRTLRLRIHVTGLDAMCRMIENGLGIGVMPGHAFDLMRDGMGRRLRSIPLTDAWARREIRLVARDFSTLPIAARALVAHLRASADPATAPPAGLAA